jgi:quinolinate synthase
MLRYVQEDPGMEYIVATEVGILHQMQQKMPHKTFIPAPTAETNTCACSECAYMKVNTLQKLYNCLKMEAPEINLESSIQQQALKPILKMLATT